MGVSLKAVDFFCGAGGMSYGLRRAGITVLAGVDSDANCRRTYEANVSGASFLTVGVETLTPLDLAHGARIEADDDNLVFVGCTPCQFWSKIRTTKDRSVQTAFLLDAFSRFVTYFRPGFIVVENVPGFLTRHSSPRGTFIEALSQQGYTYAEGLVNSNDYGVPQNRFRYLLIASRLVPHVALPPKKTGERPVVRSFIDPERGFNRLAAGQRDVGDPLHAAARLSEQNLLRIRRTPHSGGNRASWSADPALQIDAYKGRDEIFRDVYGRMAWDRPAPTITTRFNSFSNGRFGHPDQDRAISLREGAALQTFPKSFVFHGPNVASVARQIGNAVPPELARRIGHHIGRVINRA